MSDLVGTVLDRIARLPGRKTRVMVGLAGPPGAGKSTLAASLAAALGDEAVVVPMDGFHLSNAVLERKGLTHRKGAPETFDPLGFIQLLERIARRDALVYAPEYSRVLHESIGGVIAVAPETPVVLVEGNYLLLEAEPWKRIKPLLDLSIYLDAPDQTRVPGLIARQRAGGRDEEGARDWVLRSDEANAQLIAPSRARADLVLTRA